MLTILFLLQAEASIRPDVDFVATMAHFIQQRLHDVIQLIGMPGIRHFKIVMLVFITIVF